jgi:hypothetical protein
MFAAPPSTHPRHYGLYFDYRGEVPVEPCFTFVGGGALTAIASAKINVCSTGIWPNGKIDFGRLKEELLLPFVSAAHLHLGWVDRSDALAGGDDFFAEFPLFNNLTRLELGSRLMDPRVVAAVTGILRQTPNLTVLSLQIGKHGSSGSPEWGTGDHLYQWSFAVDVPDVQAAQCLRERVKEVSVEQYEGANVQRMLLKSLLRGALVLQSLRVVFANGRNSALDELANEIRSWSANPTTTRMAFC